MHAMTDWLLALWVASGESTLRFELALFGLGFVAMLTLACAAYWIGGLEERLEREAGDGGR